MAAVVSRTQVLPSIPFELETSELEDLSVSETENTNTTTSNEPEVLWNELEDQQYVPESEFEGETTTAELSTTKPTTTTVTESFISPSSSSVPTSTLASSLESSQTISEAAFEQRPPSPSGSEPPSMVLSFRSNVFHLFSSSPSDTSADTHVLFSDKHFLYKSPLQSFMSELQTHFSIENDITLDFPELNLTFGTHMIYAQKVTLAHVHLLSAAISSDQLILRATLTELPNAFLKQYNHLIVLAQSRKDSFIRPLSPTSSTIQDLPVPATIPQTTTGQSEFLSEAELEGEEEDESFETSETVETVEELGNTDEVHGTTEEAKEGDQLELNEETELEYPVPAAEEIDVEIDELNSDLVPPTENESPFSPSSSVKTHARHYEAGDDEDELARKRRRFTAQTAEIDSAGLADFVDEGL